MTGASDGSNQVSNLINDAVETAGNLGSDISAMFSDMTSFAEAGLTFRNDGSGNLVPVKPSEDDEDALEAYNKFQAYRLPSIPDSVADALRDMDFEIEGDAGTGAGSHSIPDYMSMGDKQVSTQPLQAWQRAGYSSKEEYDYFMDWLDDRDDD